jgi:hypothetical protein
MPNILGKPYVGTEQTQWAERHRDAILKPSLEKGEAIGVLIQAWAHYATGYEMMFNPEGGGSMLGDDYVLGVAWVEAGSALRTLLNGTCGRLDCGTLDGFILDTMREHGVDTEAL